VSLTLALYYTIEHCVLSFIPAKYRVKDVTGQKVLITGAGSGLGRGMSEKFASLGCDLILWDINPSANNETADICKKHGGKVWTYTCDLSKRLAIYATAKKVEEEVGDIDILINNAGIVTGRKLLDCPDEIIEATMNINCNAHFWTLKSFLPSMMARNHGHIVSIASMAGIGGLNGLADYCASKFAAVGLHESITNEMEACGKDGIHTTLVCPGFINTGMFDGVGVKWKWAFPLLEPEYVVNTIVRGVLTNETLVMMPFCLKVIAMIKYWIPYKALAVVGKYAGYTSSMDNFRGRQKNN